MVMNTKRTKVRASILQAVPGEAGNKFNNWAVLENSKRRLVQKEIQRNPRTSLFNPNPEITAQMFKSIKIEIKVRAGVFLIRSE